ISRSRRKDLTTTAIGIAATDRGAHLWIARVHIRTGAHAHVHFLSIPVEQHGARPVALAEILHRDDLFARPSRHLFGVVFVSLQRRRLSDVEVILPERQTVRTVELLDQLLALRLEDVNRPSLTVAHQDFVARPQCHVSWLFEALGEQFDAETLGHMQLRSGGLSDHARPVGRGRRRKWRRQLDLRSPAGEIHQQKTRALFHTVPVYYENGQTRSTVLLSIQLLSSSFKNFISSRTIASSFA